MPDFEPFERVLLTIEYDGSAFYGWQRQARLRSVQEELERALARATGRETGGIKPVVPRERRGGFVSRGYWIPPRH